jgi:hypothetical protein
VSESANAGLGKPDLRGEFGWRAMLRIERLVCANSWWYFPGMQGAGGTVVPQVK